MNQPSDRPGKTVKIPSRVVSELITEDGKGHHVVYSTGTLEDITQFVENVIDNKKCRHSYLKSKNLTGFYV